MEHKVDKKVDNIIGKEVHDYLVSKGVETPLTDKISFTDRRKKNTIERYFTKIMETLGLDLTDDSLQDTPRRVAKMYVDEIFYGLDYNKFPKVTTVSNKMKYDEMVIVRDISVQSNCEHHFVVISGKASVAYMPKDRVLGLSKINRIVEFFSKRPQIQERLTEQIYYALAYLLGTEDVAVFINAEHYCVKSRGVKDEESDTVTSKVGGVFRETDIKQEALTLLSFNK